MFTGLGHGLVGTSQPHEASKAILAKRRKPRQRGWRSIGHEAAQASQAFRTKQEGRLMPTQVPTEADKVRSDLAKAAEGKSEAAHELEHAADKKTVEAIEQEAADGPEGRGVSR